MRILFFSHYFPPEVNAPASRTFDHCVRWVQAGHDVTVVTCVPNCPDGVVYPGYRSRLRRQVEEVEGIRVVRVWTHLAPNAGTVRRIVNYVSYMFSAALASLRLPRPDVIIATSPQFFCGWAGVLASRLKRVPLVLEIRDIWPEGIAAAGGMENRHILLGMVDWLARRMYLAADHIVTVGRGYRDHLLAKVDVADHTTVITNGVDLSAFVPAQADNELLARWGLAGKFVCCYTGTIGMAHRLEVVLEAAKILRDKGRDDIAFWLVGDGATREELEKKAAEERLGNRVVFAGRLPKEQMPAVLASSNVCLIHLRKCDLYTTVIPSKIFETMAMGVPIIMGVDGIAREIVMKAGAAVEMEPESPESLVQAVEQLADDPRRLASRGQAARDFVATNYDRNVLAARFLDLLQEIVSRSKAQKETNPVPPGEARKDAVSRG